MWINYNNNLYSVSYKATEWSILWVLVCGGLGVVFMFCCDGVDGVDDNGDGVATVFFPASILCTIFEICDFSIFRAHDDTDFET